MSASSSSVLGRRTLLVRGTLIMLCLVAGVLSVGRGCRNALADHRSDDFQWYPAKVLLSGENPYREYLEAPVHFAAASSETSYSLPSYPVTGYFFLWPYAAFDWATAKRAWMITNLICLVGIVLALGKLGGLEKRPNFLWGLAVAGLFCASTPVRDQIAAGQHTLFSLCCLLWAWIAGRSKAGKWSRWVIAPLLLAAAWLKFTVTLPLTLAFLLHRRWREPLLAAGVHVVLFAVACAYTGTGPLAMLSGYLEACERILSEAGVHSDVWNTRFLAESLAPGGKWLKPVLSFVALGIPAWVILRRRAEGKGDELETFAMLAFPACLVGFHMRYDFVVLVLPLVWLGKIDQWKRPIFSGALLVVIAANWWGARALERLYYHAVDPVYGYWDAVGLLGLTVLGVGTWLVFAVLLGTTDRTACFSPRGPLSLYRGAVNRTQRNI